MKLRTHQGMTCIVYSLTSIVVHILGKSRKIITSQFIPWPIPIGLHIMNKMIIYPLEESSISTGLLKVWKLKCMCLIRKRTESLGISDVCPLLYCVPRTLASHTSYPLSAKINPNDSSGEFTSHVEASWNNSTQVNCLSSIITLYIF